MSKYFIHEVYVRANIGDSTEGFNSTYLVDEPDVQFLSLDKNITVSSWTTQEVAEEDASHILKYFDLSSEINEGRIEINGYPLDAEQD